MYLTVHATAGLLLAQHIKNPYLVFLAALGSHFALDLVPHGDELPLGLSRPQVLRRLTKAALVDLATLGFFLLLYIATRPGLASARVVAGVAGGMLPDTLEAIYLITQTRWLKQFCRFHDATHNVTKLKLGWQLGMLLQCLTFAALWLLIVQH